MNFQAKYGLAQYIKLRSRVISAEWNEEEGKYHLQIETPEGPKQDWCHVLINGSGVLNNWKCLSSIYPTPPLALPQLLTPIIAGPAIKGLHDFKGLLLHSAAWDESAQYQGKRVAVIGTGSSAIQVRLRGRFITYRARLTRWGIDCGQDPA